MPCQHTEARVKQFELEVFAQEEGLLGCQQGRFRLVDAAHPHQAAGLVAHHFPGAQQATGPPGLGCCRAAAVAEGGAAAAAGHLAHGVQRGQVVHQPHQVVQPGQQGGGVGDGGGLDTVHVAVDGTLQRGQPGLGRTGDTLVGGFEGTQQRLGAAGQAGLLLCQAQGRLDVHHQVFVPRARQALHQVFQLRALQGHFTQAGVVHSEAGGGFTRQLLGFACDGAGLNGLGAGVGVLPRQLLLDVVEFLPQQATGHQGGDGDQRHRIKHRTGDARRRCSGHRGWHGLGDRRVCAGRGEPGRITWFERGLRRHGSDSIEATTASSVGRDALTTPKPACSAACAIRGWVAMARAACQDWPGSHCCRC